MKIFYEEVDIFPATYNFRDDEVASYGDGDEVACVAGIDFVTTAAITGDPTISIVALVDGHKNVLKLDDEDADANDNIYIYNAFSGAQTSGTIEFWVRFGQVNKGVRLYLNGDVGNNCLLHWDSTGDVQYNDGAYHDTGESYNANQWYHYRIEFDCADDWHLWIDSVSIDGAGYGFGVANNNIDSLRIYNYRWSTDDPTSYWDAFGYSWDSDYTVGDNTNDWDWRRISAIKQYPEIVHRMDETSQISFIVDDFEGALYSTWSGLNFIMIKIEDNSENILFRGYLTGKDFEYNQLVCVAHGLSVRLDWIPLRRDYVAAEGLVKTIPYAGIDVHNQTIVLRPNADPTKDWSQSSTANHDEDIDDAVLTGEAGDGNFIGFKKDFDDGDLDIFDMTTQPCTSVQEVTLHFRGKDNNQNVFEAFTAYISDDLGVSWEAPKSVRFNSATYTWISVTWVAADLIVGGWTSLDGMRVKLISAADMFMVAGDQTWVDVMYAVATYTHSSVYALELETDDSGLLNWDLDKFVSDTDMGILIVDNTENVDELTFEATANPVITNGTYVSGDKESLDDINDNDNYYFTDTLTPHDVYVEVAMGDAGGILDTQKLHKIEINYNIGHHLPWHLFGFIPRSSISINLYNGSDWSKTWCIYDSSDATGVWEWYQGTLILEGTDTELQAYLTKTDNKYTALAGIRVYVEGWVLDGQVSVKMDLLDATIHYAAFDVQPIMEQIDVNGAEFVYVVGHTWTESELSVGDSFKIGYASLTVLQDLFNKAKINARINSTLSNYIAQTYKGTYCKEILKKICLLEGLHWWEDHVNNRVIVAREADFVDSEVDLTSGGSINWKFSDDNNYYYAVEVYGRAEYEIYYRAEDTSIDSPRVKTIIEETIMTLPEAKEVAEAQLLEYKTKRPSVEIPLSGVNTALQIGKTVGLTMVRPTVVAADYPMRMTKRSKVGTSIKTIIFCGLGHSTLSEKVSNTINKAMYLAHKAHTDRLISG